MGRGGGRKRRIGGRGGGRERRIGCTRKRRREWERRGGGGGRWGRNGEGGIGRWSG